PGPDRTGGVEVNTATLRLHAGNRRATAVDDAADVDVHDAVEQGVGRLFKRREGLRQAGVVEQDVDAAETVDRALDHGLDLFAVRYVNLRRIGVAAGCADLFGRLVGAGRVEVGHQDARALFG